MANPVKENSKTQINHFGNEIKDIISDTEILKIVSSHIKLFKTYFKIGMKWIFSRKRKWPKLATKEVKNLNRQIITEEIIEETMYVCMYSDNFLLKQIHQTQMVLQAISFIT